MMNNPCGKAVLCAVAAAGTVTMGVAWAHEAGRMTGGGSFFCSDISSGSQRVTHGFELHCKLDTEPVPEPNNLEINFSGGDNFHLASLSVAFCSNTALDERPPSAGFDTYHGEGTGALNGKPATISFTFTDAGEPGTKDTASVVITVNGAATPALRCEPATFLTFGNHQAHKATGSKQ